MYNDIGDTYPAQKTNFFLYTVKEKNVCLHAQAEIK